jgi:hypothetical protein
MASTALLFPLTSEDLPARARPLPHTVRRPAPARHLCTDCGTRPARFQYRGVVRADRTHTLCFKCFRAAANRARALSIGGAAEAPPVPPHRTASPDDLGRGAPRLRGELTDERGPAAAKYEALALRRRRAQIAARRALDAAG